MHFNLAVLHLIVDKIINTQLFWSIIDQLVIYFKTSVENFIINLFIDNKINLIENSIKIVNDHLY
jgi:hypothetical protein